MRVCACILRQAHGEASLIWSPSHFLPSLSNRSANSFSFSVLVSNARVSHRGVSLRPPQLHNHCSDRVEHAFARVTTEAEELTETFKRGDLREGAHQVVTQVTCVLFEHRGAGLLVCAGLLACARAFLAFSASAVSM